MKLNRPLIARLSLIFLLASPVTSHAKNLIDESYLINSESQSTLKLTRTGVGKNNVIQGVALDQENNWIYTLHVTGKPESGVINKFNYSETGIIKAEDAQLPSQMIGHQGFTVYNKDGSIFSSAGTAVENKGWYISHFTFSPNSSPQDLAIIKIFDDGYDTKTSSMPVFTSDDRYLVVRGKNEKGNLLRIYDIKNTNLSSGDLSNNHSKEWNVSNEITNDKYDLQAITADERHIYILSGGKNNLPKRMFIYDLNGKLIQKNENVTLGQSEAALSGEEGHWEPEGMSYNSRYKKLLIAFAMGDKHNRTAIIYSIPINQ